MQLTKVWLELQVCVLQKEPYKRDYILQKRPIILRSLLIVATPYDLARNGSTFDALMQLTKVWLEAQVCVTHRVNHVTHE